MAMAMRVRSNLSLLKTIVRAESIYSQKSISENPNQFTRDYSSATGSTPSKEVKVKVPLSLFGGAGNYASALFVAAAKANVLEKVESEILDLVNASTKAPLFSQFIRDVSVPGATRVKAINEISDGAKFTEITKNFLAILAENGRLRNIDSITKKFVELTMAHKGEVNAIVTSVIPLPPQEEKELKEALQEIIGQGKTIKIEQKIDPNILGGLVVEFDKKLFDMSIRSRAIQMERFLREPVNFGSL